MHSLVFFLLENMFACCNLVIFHRHFQQRNITGSRISVIMKRGRFENSANLRVLWKNKKEEFWRGAVPKFGSFLWRLQPCCYSDVTLLSTCCVVRLLNFYPDFDRKYKFLTCANWIPIVKHCNGLYNRDFDSYDDICFICGLIIVLAIKCIQVFLTCNIFRR